MLVRQKKYVLFFILMFSSCLLSATITITSQSQLEATFDSTTTEISETLILDGSSIVDLSPLQNVWFIGGQFYIIHTGLTNLNGLENLYFTQRIFISNNDSLETIHLPGLNDLFFDFYIHDNVSLISITGGSLPSNNESLSIDIFNNPLLKDISLLEGIKNIWGLRIYNCPNILSLAPIKELNSAIYIRLKNFHFIEHLNDFPVFTQIGSIDIQDFPLVNSIEVFSNTFTDELRLFSLADFPLLENLDPLEVWDFPIQELHLSGLGLVQDLEAFNNIPNVEELEVIDNPNLQAINFDQLTRMRSVFISGCNMLSSINGLALLDTLDCGINIQYCENLADLSDLNHLSIITGECNFAQKFLLKNLPALAAQDFLASLRYIGGEFLIDSCGMDSLYGFSNLEYAERGIDIKRSEMVDLKGFEKLRYCVFFRVSGNNNLLEIYLSDSLGVDYSDVAILIEENFNLEFTNGGGQIRRLGLAIRDCPSLAFFPTLPLLNRWLGFNFTNTGFTNIDFIMPADTMGAIGLTNNLYLEDISVFESIMVWDASLTSNPCVYIENNPLIESLEPFKGYPGFVNGSMHIIGNELITSLEGMDSVKRCRWGVYIQDNPNLISLEGLNNLSYVETSFIIQNNTLLEDISAISNLDTVGLNVDSFLELSGNPSLSNCDALCTIDSFAYIPGGIILADNGSTCLSMNSVLFHCANPTTATADISTTSNISIYPNPTTGDLQINFDDFYSGRAEVINYSGQLMKVKSFQGIAFELDISGLVSGIYFIRLTDEHEHVIDQRRILKME